MYGLIGLSRRKRVSNHVYLGSTIKIRKYNYLYIDHFGRSPSFCIKSDKYPKDYGLTLKEARFSFTEVHFGAKVKYLELEVDKERWSKARLKKWIAIAETEGDKPTNGERQETIETDLALSMKEEVED